MTPNKIANFDRLVGETLNELRHSGTLESALQLYLNIDTCLNMIPARSARLGTLLLRLIPTHHLELHFGHSLKKLMIYVQGGDYIL